MSKKIKMVVALRESLSARIQRFSSLLPNLLALLLALLSGVLLFNTTIFSSLLSTIISVGLDSLRAQLIAALMISGGAGLIGAVGGRRKLGATLGAGAVFYFGYLAGFLQFEMQPVHDPGGNLEPLNGSALVNTALVMIALAILAAFIGAAVGMALGEVLFDPPSQLVRHIWQRARFAHAHTHNISAVTHQEVQVSHASDSRTAKSGVASWLGAAVMVLLFVLAAGSGDLFLYSPDIGLHMAPTLHKKSDLPAHGTLVEDSVISPALNGQKKPFLVYFPPSYNTPQGKTKRYPVLYLLHGSPGSDHDWFTAGKADQSANTLIALDKIAELILILPDGHGHSGQPSEWGNSFDHRQNIETYVAVDLVKYVDSKYRTQARTTDRGIGGLSMGAFGAMNIALHHPDVFGFVIALGGYYRAEGSIWGKNASYIHENSPIDFLPTDKPAQRLDMYIGAATKDQPYYTYALQFVHELNQLHLPYHLDVQSGYHSWKVWQTQMYNALTWLHWGNEL